jgi:putative toxin-antitoxin system antitoxin component (TIGR02293 family)
MLTATVDLKKEQETVFKWLGLRLGIKARSNSSFSYVNIIREGLQNKSITSFIKHSTLSKKQVAKLLHISERTLQRNSPDKLIDMVSSERLLELTRLFHQGIEVFNEKGKFITWLNRPNRSLNDQIPIELIETSIGIDLVIDELLRIEYGVYS